MKHIAILGGGISGLSLAYFLQKKFGNEIKISIIESKSHFGGCIDSVCEDGFFFELGPRAFRSSNCSSLLKCIENLGINNELIFSEPNFKNRYLWIDGKLQKLPTGPLSFLTSPIMKGVPLALIKEFYKKASQCSDETIYDFFSRRLSADIAEKFADPLTLGIYAGDIKKLSMRSCFPTLFKWEQKHGSIVKGMIKDPPKKKKDLKSSLFSLKGGMQSLVNVFCNNLDINAMLSKIALSIEFKNRKVVINFHEGEKIRVDHLISTIPAKDLLQIINSKKTSALLSQFTSSSIAVACLGFDGQVMKRKGFGYLIPSKESEEALGAIWDSCLFPQMNENNLQSRFTYLIGEKNCPNFDNYNKEELSGIAKKAIKKHLGVFEKPKVSIVKKIKAALPQYHLGHFQRVENLEKIVKEHFPALTISGNNFYGVSVNDCIAKSEEIANNFTLQ